MLRYLLSKYIFVFIFFFLMCFYCIVIFFVKVCYVENFLMVFYGISCVFFGGKKIGIVGRMGSGKFILI